jgi:Uma2 family endonuclease
MSAVAHARLTPQEYLARERRAEFKSEFFRGETIAMAGASFAHTRLRDNLARILGNAFEGTPCQALSGDLRVKVAADGRYTYPDLVVVCGEPEFEDAVLDTLLNPVMLVEVLSDSTERLDRGAKFHSYQRIESLREYVMISQHAPVVERYVRHEGESWLLTPTVGLGASVTFDSIGVSVTLADIYQRVRFPNPANDDEDRPLGE